MVSRVDRAKQFLPFSALSPLSQALREKEKVIEEKLEVSEEMIYEISNVLQLISKDTKVSVKYYCDEQYLKVSGKVKYIDTIRKYLVIENNKIYFENILNICIL